MVENKDQFLLIIRRMFMQTYKRGDQKQQIPQMPILPFGMKPVTNNLAQPGYDVSRLVRAGNRPIFGIRNTGVGNAAK